MQTWKYPSSSGPGEYTVTLHDDGLLGCDCRGYLIKKNGKPRFCRHTDDIIKKLRLHIMQRGDFRYVVESDEHAGVFIGNAVQADLIPQLDHGQIYASAMERGYVNPMLAVAPTKGQKVSDYDPAEWVMEEKYDGERKIVSVHQGEVYAWSRPRSGKGEVGKEDQLPPHLVAAFKLLPEGTYDGEIIVPGATKSWDVANLANRERLCFVAFDILRLQSLENIDFMTVPHTHRQELLKSAIGNLRFDGDPYLYVGPTFQPIESEVQKIWDRGGEGAIVKRKTSLYKPGWRCPDWIKIKLIMSATLTVTGYTKGKNGPYSSVNLRDDEGIETRVKTKDNATLRLIEANPNAFIGKRLVIEYQGRTPDKSYRHPMWQYWEDEIDRPPTS